MFSPALARKNLRAKERREAKAEEAAWRATKYLKRKFSQCGIKISSEPRRPLLKFDKRIYLFKWAKWEFFYAWCSGLRGKFIIICHPLYGEWQINLNSLVNPDLIEKILREGGIDV